MSVAKKTQSYYELLIQGCKSLRANLQEQYYGSDPTIKRIIISFFPSIGQTTKEPDYIQQIKELTEQLSMLEESQYKKFRSHHYKLDKMELQCFWLHKYIRDFTLDFPLQLNQKPSERQKAQMGEQQYEASQFQQQIINYSSMIEEFLPYSQAFAAAQNEQMETINFNHHQIYLIIYLTTIIKVIYKITIAKMPKFDKLRLRLMLIFQSMKKYCQEKILEKTNLQYQIKFILEIALLGIVKEQIIYSLQTLLSVLICYEQTDKNNWFLTLDDYNINNVKSYFDYCMHYQIQNLLLRENIENSTKCEIRHEFIHKIFFHQMIQKDTAQKQWKKWNEYGKLNDFVKQLSNLFGQLQARDYQEQVCLRINNGIFQDMFQNGGIVCLNNHDKAFLATKADFQEKIKNYKEYSLPNFAFFCNKYNIYSFLLFPQSKNQDEIVKIFREKNIYGIKVTKKTFDLLIPDSVESMEVHIILITQASVLESKHRNNQIFQSSVKTHLQGFFHILTHEICSQRYSSRLSDYIPVKEILDIMKNKGIQKQENQQLEELYYCLYLERISFLQKKSNNIDQLSTTYLVFGIIRLILISRYKQFQQIYNLQDIIGCLERRSEMLFQKTDPTKLEYKTLQKEMKKIISYKDYQDKLNQLDTSFQYNSFMYFLKLCKQMLAQKKDVKAIKRQESFCAIFNILNQAKYQMLFIKLQLGFCGLKLASALYSRKNEIKQDEKTAFYNSVQRPRTIIACKIKTWLRNIEDQLLNKNRQIFVSSHLKQLKNQLNELHPKNIPYPSDQLYDLPKQPKKEFDCQQRCPGCCDFNKNCSKCLAYICKELQEDNDDLKLQDYSKYIKKIYGMTIDK